MTKALLQLELVRVNEYIDIRIKAGKQFKALEKVRKQLLEELNK